MDKPDVDIALLKKLVELVEKHGLDELRVDEGNISVTIKSKAAPPPPPPHGICHAPEPHEVLQAREPAPVAVPEQAEEPEGDVYDIVAPLVGVFYRARPPMRRRSWRSATSSKSARKSASSRQ